MFVKNCYVPDTGTSVGTYLLEFKRYLGDVSSDIDLSSQGHVN